jgi:hypothetical protein
VKSPLSMNFGRISTSKCRGKLQKMGVLYTHSPKSPGPFPKLPKIHFYKIKKFQKIGTARQVEASTRGRQATSGRWDQRSPAGRGLTPGPVGLFPFFLIFFFFLLSTFCASGQLFLIGCSTCPPCPDFSLKLQTSITFDP